MISEQVFDDNPCLDSGLNLETRVTILTGDLDVASGYPNGQIAANASRETTRKELHEVQGIPRSINKPQGINLTGGATNALWYCTQMGGLPSMFDIVHLTDI